MFEILANGPCTIAGTLTGLALAFGMNRWAPVDPASIYFEAGFVALGFVIGLVMDLRRDRR